MAVLLVESTNSGLSNAADTLTLDVALATDTVVGGCKVVFAQLKPVASALASSLKSCVPPMVGLSIVPISPNTVPSAGSNRQSLKRMGNPAQLYMRQRNMADC